LNEVSSRQTEMQYMEWLWLSLFESLMDIKATHEA